MPALPQLLPLPEARHPGKTVLLLMNWDFTGSFCPFLTMKFCAPMPMNFSPAENYEKKHQGDYLITLEEYLLCNGSIQAAAAHLYCHRNTVNKRIRTLREELSYNLDDPQVCFELNAAFAIRHFLKLFP